jgi:hypothetical protein
VITEAFLIAFLHYPYGCSLLNITLFFCFTQSELHLQSTSHCKIKTRAAEMPQKSLTMKMAIAMFVKMKNPKLSTWHISKI